MWTQETNPARLHAGGGSPSRPHEGPQGARTTSWPRVPVEQHLRIQPEQEAHPVHPGRLDHPYSSTPCLALTARPTYTRKPLTPGKQRPCSARARPHAYPSRFFLLRKPPTALNKAPPSQKYPLYLRKLFLARCLLLFAPHAVPARKNRPHGETRGGGSG